MVRLKSVCGRVVVADGSGFDPVPAVWVIIIRTKLCSFGFALMCKILC